MLTHPSDLPADPAIGDAISALSPQRVLPVLRERLTAAPSDGEADWGCCRPIEALYDPGEHIRVAYVLCEDDSLPARRAWPSGHVVYLRHPVRDSVSRRGFVVPIDGVDFEVYRFPNDRRLRGLRKFTGRDQAAAVWQQWVTQDEPNLDIAPETLRRELLRYVPEQKCIIHLHAKWYDAVAENHTKRAVAVRVSDVDACKRIYARTIAVRRVRNSIEGLFRVPRPVAIDTDLGLLAIRWVWGDSMLDMCLSDDPAVLMARVASGLNAFHKVPIDHLDLQLPAQFLTSAVQCATDLSAASPSHAETLGAVIERLRRDCPKDMSNDGPCTIHNDFHWDQLRGRPDRMTILDLERCARGDAMVDVANFVSQLSMLPHRASLDVTVDQANQWRSAFLTAWEQTTGAPIDHARLGWYSAVSLLTLARGMMRHLRPGWPTVVDECVRQAASAVEHRDDLGVVA